MRIYSRIVSKYFGSFVQSVFACENVGCCSATIHRSRICMLEEQFQYVKVPVLARCMERRRMENNAVWIC